MQAQLFISHPRALVLRLAPSCIFTMFLDTCEILKATETFALMPLGFLGQFYY
jgi:hypothetical protein